MWRLAHAPVSLSALEEAALEQRRSYVREYAREYRRVGRGPDKEYFSAWRKTNPEKIRGYGHKRRAAAWATAYVGQYTITDLQLIKRSQFGRCYYCTCKLTRTNTTQST